VRMKSASITAIAAASAYSRKMLFFFTLFLDIDPKKKTFELKNEILGI